MGPVSWADDLTRLHFRIFQRLAVMCATVFYCVKLGAAAYDKQGKSVDVRAEGFRIFDRVGAPDVDPVGTQNIPVCRRAASDIMLWFQGGSNVNSTRAALTVGMR